MANEFKHKDPGGELTQAEFIASDGTGHIFESQAQGDTIYASSSTVLVRLAKDANATRVLTNTGTNNNPAWAQVTLTTGVTGTLPVGNGGTGATTLTDGGILLGSATAAVTAMAVLADSEMIVGDGSTDPVAESGATLRTSIGVGTGDSPQFTGIELGHASDTTITKGASGLIEVEGVRVVTVSATQTLTNKTLTAPTLTTPALGTPASGVLTNATGLPEAGLAVSNAPTNGYMLTAQSGDAGGMTWAAAGGVSLSGSTDNTIVTVTGSNALAGEANLTYSTDLSITSGNVVIATAGKGIDFSAQTATATGSMAAEVLDHYEEGSFSPGLADASSNSFNMSVGVGRYTRVGNLVHAHGRVVAANLTGVTTTDAARITGLPFTVLNVAHAQGACVLDGESLAITSGTCATGRYLNNATHIDLRLWDSTGGVTALLVSEITANGELLFSITYRT